MELSLEDSSGGRRHLATVSRARLRRTWIDGLIMLIRKSFNGSFSMGQELVN